MVFAYWSSWHGVGLLPTGTPCLVRLHKILKQQNSSFLACSPDPTNFSLLVCLSFS